MSIIYEFAPAKLNLYLHVTGRRDDGYHNLDSLVAFASVGDQIKLEPASAFSFVIEGPQAGALQNEPTDKNLVVQAAQALAAVTANNLNVKLTLVKNLPVASGIGGGSSDAAAALRALAQHWRVPENDSRLSEVAVQLGQDVLSCLVVENNYLTSDGTLPAPDLPYADCVLVNPGKGLPTPAVYKLCRESKAAFSPAMQLPESPRDLGRLIELLRERGNDLYPPACQLMPEIAGVIAALESTNCLLARMSGSGATCFAFYADRSAARRAAGALLAAHPDWWVAQAYIPYRKSVPQALAAQG